MNCLHCWQPFWKGQDSRVENEKLGEDSHLRSSHKLNTSLKGGGGERRRRQTIVCLEQIKLNLDEPAFSHLYRERCLIMKMGGTKQILGDSRGSLGLDRRPPNTSPLHPPESVVGCCYSSSTLDLRFLPENPSFRASKAKRNTKGLSDTEEWPTDAQQELQHQIASSFDISAKVFIQPLFYFHQTFHTGRQNKNLHLQFVHLWH